VRADGRGPLLDPKEALLAFHAFAHSPDFHQHESDQDNYDPSVNMEKRVGCSHFDALLNFHFYHRMLNIPGLQRKSPSVPGAAHCEITTCELLVITNAVLGINGKMGLKLYCTCTCTTLPGVLSGVHVVVTVTDAGLMPAGTLFKYV
jgi:hypothetical protein